MPARTHAQAPTSLAALVTHGKLATRTPADKVTKHLQSPGVIVRLVLRLVPFVERASARLRAAAALALRGEPSHPSRRGKAPRLGQTPQRWQAIEEEPAPKLFYGASCRSERLGTRTDHWEIEHIITAPAIASRLDTEDMKPPLTRLALQVCFSVLMVGISERKSKALGTSGSQIKCHGRAGGRMGSLQGWATRVLVPGGRPAICMDRRRIARLRSLVCFAARPTMVYP